VSFGFVLENVRHNSIDIVKYEEVEKGLFAKRIVQKRTRIGTIGWPGEGTEVAVRDLKHIREMCLLCEENGVDSDAFYFYMAVVDYFVNHYRKVLGRLART
jgi:hypothetical protein